MEIGIEIEGISPLMLHAFTDEAQLEATDGGRSAAASGGRSVVARRAAFGCEKDRRNSERDNERREIQGVSDEPFLHGRPTRAVGKGSECAIPCQWLARTIRQTGQIAADPDRRAGSLACGERSRRGESARTAFATTG